MLTQPQREHEWLTRLVGEWRFETESRMGPDTPIMKSTGRETVRSLGGHWTLFEGEGDMPGGGIGKTIITLGYDPAKSRYVGTFVGSMMAKLWIYEGTLDAAEKVLTLDTEGPNFTQTGLAKFQDIIEIVDDNHRLLRAQVLTEDGKWMPFMTSHYYRT